mmetsp:Transcript_23872/g.35286  ORF Transcript_23872/g.35286 Transcript_23872/m.35286 type:complete len:1118 (-) Transcript_23872:21-3374(-)
MATPNLRKSLSVEMNVVGMALGEVNTRNLTERRLKKGECPTCGNKTHKIGLFKKKTALSIEGSCLYGRCLLCNPLEGYMQRPPPGEEGPRVPPRESKKLPPKNVVIENEKSYADDSTLMSGITMDHPLIVGERDWNGEFRHDEMYNYEEDSYDVGSNMRYKKPSPSIGPSIGRVGMKSPERLGQSSSDSLNSGRPRPPKRFSSHKEAMMDQIGLDIIQDQPHQKPTRINNRTSVRQSRVQESVSHNSSKGPKTISFARSSRSNSPPTPSKQNKDTVSSKNSQKEITFMPPHDFHNESKQFQQEEEQPETDLKWEQQYESQKQPRVKESREESEQYYREYAYIQDDRKESIHQMQWSDNKAIPSEEIKNPPFSSRSRRGLPDDDCTEVFEKNGRTKSGQPLPSRIKQDFHYERQGNSLEDIDIDEIITSLGHSNRDRCFRTLAELVMARGGVAKGRIKDNGGVQILVESMWSDMGDAAVMEAACELLFALVVSSDGAPESDVLVGDSAEGAIDALLITMQTHLTLESIQHLGCSILHCLASASKNGVPDGTLSGAVLMVVNAMAMHGHSLKVQRIGIRALYSQCMLSKYAEANKKNLETCGQDGDSGINVIRKAMEIAQSDIITIELAARLYWTLASNEDVARQLMESPYVANEIVDAINRYHNRPEAATLMEAAYGALANLARVCDDRNVFRDNSVMTKVLQSFEAFQHDEAVCTEACTLIGVLAADPQNLEYLSSLGVVNAISEVVHLHDYNESLREEALFALVSLTRGSEQNKLALSSDSKIRWLIGLMRDSAEPIIIQKMACNLVGSLCVLQESAQIAVKHDVLDVILKLLKSNPSERNIQEASFMTLRNITNHPTGVDLFVKFETSKMILDAMDASTESVTAQLNACGMLWNICAKAKKDPSTLVYAGAITQVVKAMQTHMESGKVLEMACGALWCLIDQSDSRKNELLDCDAIDAITCSLVMHPKELPTLEKACGLLANICTSPRAAEAIAGSQGISMIVEAMTNNSSSMKLLELGVLALRNLVLTNHEFADEASNSISTVIKCMNENPDAVGFQREACNALWALAAQSEECKSKILALDGVTVLMGSLEHNTSYDDVQDAARGAINQLALS